MSEREDEALEKLINSFRKALDEHFDGQWFVDPEGEDVEEIRVKPKDIRRYIEVMQDALDYIQTSIVIKHEGNDGEIRWVRRRY